jgi:hypothetical protein
MKTPKILLAATATMICLVLASCSSMNHLTMTVTEPAPVEFPSGIKKVGVINRTQLPADNQTADDIDKVLSIEGKHLDSLGAEQATRGLYDELVASSRFDKVVMIIDHGLTTPGMGVFPATIPWSTVEDICAKNDVEAIFILDFYDTDAKVDYKTNPVEITGPLGIKTTMLEHTATINTIIKTGFRIYDPAAKIVRDEFMVTPNVVSSGRGINPMKAIEAVIGRKDAVLQMSNDVGHDYALRIFPFKVRVGREYYVRGTENFKIGKRRAVAGDWHGAASLWEQELNNPKRKIAGRACYNMAIICEIDGNLDDAVTWASKSYTDYNNKRALEYLNVLKFRVVQNARLQNN